MNKIFLKLINLVKVTLDKLLPGLLVAKKDPNLNRK